MAIKINKKHIFGFIVFVSIMGGVRVDAMLVAPGQAGMVTSASSLSDVKPKQRRRAKSLTSKDTSENKARYSPRVEIIPLRTERREASRCTSHREVPADEKGEVWGLRCLLGREREEGAPAEIVEYVGRMRAQVKDLATMALGEGISLACAKKEPCDIGKVGLSLTDLFGGGLVNFLSKTIQTKNYYASTLAPTILVLSFISRIWAEANAKTQERALSYRREIKYFKEKLSFERQSARPREQEVLSLLTKINEAQRAHDEASIYQEADGALRKAFVVLKDQPTELICIASDIVEKSIEFRRQQQREVLGDSSDSSSDSSLDSDE